MIQTHSGCRLPCDHTRPGGAEQRPDVECSNRRRQKRKEDRQTIKGDAYRCLPMRQPWEGMKGEGEAEEGGQLSFL